MTRSIKISILWLLTVCGFACHSICDVLPMFWGKNMAIAATDGNVDQGMIVFMMTLSYLIPACGVLCMLWKEKALKVINAVLGRTHRLVQHRPCVHGAAFRQCWAIRHHAHDDYRRPRAGMV